MLNPLGVHLTPWTDTGLDQNFQGDLGAIGPFETLWGSLYEPIPYAKKTQHVQLFENPLPGTPPFAISKVTPRSGYSHVSPRRCYTTLPHIGSPKCDVRCSLVSRFGLCGADTTLTFQSFFFFVSFVFFFSFCGFPFLLRFALFSKDFKGSAERKILFFGGGDPHTFFLPKTQKYASDPRPPQKRQKYETKKSGQNMTPNASKQGKFGSLGAIFFVHMFTLYVGALGLQKESPSKAQRWPLSGHAS